MIDRTKSLNASGTWCAGWSPTPMDKSTYPGKRLSLSQLVFALNEELERAIRSPGCVAKDRSD